MQRLILVKEDGDRSFKGEKGKAKVFGGPKLFFNSIVRFFEKLRLYYQSQWLDKMLELQQFQLKDKEAYQDACHWLQCLVENTKAITMALAINYGYNILECNKNHGF